jgi:HK97 family phage prohead protease
MVNTTAAHWTFDHSAKALVQPRADGGVMLRGYLSDFEPDFVNDYFAPDALRKGLTEALARGWPVLLNHDWRQPVGRVTNAFVDDKGLFIEAEIPPPEPGTYAAQFLRLVKAGAINAWSIGGRWVRERIGSLNKIIRAQILEASLCGQGINDRARFEVVAGGKMLAAPVVPQVDELAGALELLGLRLAVYEARYGGRNRLRIAAT